MPIIDSYTLLGSWPQSEVELSLESLAPAMKARGVGTCLVSHTSAIFYDSAIGNRQAAEACAGHAPLLPVAVMNPLRYPACLTEIDRCLAEGIRLFRLCPLEHGYPFSAQVGPLTEVLQHLAGAQFLSVDLSGQPVPALTPEIAARLPVPTAFTVRPDQLGLLIQAASASQNVLVETSALLAGGALESAVKHLGANRVVFGSQAPLRTLGSAVMTVQFADLAEADRQAIFEGNLRQILG